MSAYIVNNRTIDILVTAFINTYSIEYKAENYKPINSWIIDIQELACSIGQSLLDQNYASVNHRYHEQETPSKYTYEPVTVNNALILDAIDEYNYQACETPDYYSSKLYYSLRRLEKAMLKRYIKFDDRISDKDKELVI